MAKSLSIRDPFVIYDPINNLYKMWYTECSIHNGNYVKIGYATSKNGIDWINQKTTLHENEIYDPSIIYDPTVVYNPNDSKDPYKMWYTGFSKFHDRIGYAVSLDGKHWNDRGMILDLGLPGNFDSVHVFNPFVIYDPTDINAPYKMWYTGYNNFMYRIGYATSKDGKHWTKQGLVNNLENMSNHQNVGLLSVVHNPKNSNYPYEVWCVVSDKSNHKYVHIASLNGIDFNDQVAEILIKGDSKKVDNFYGLNNLSVIYNPNNTDDPYEGFYMNNILPSSDRIAYIISSDGINWTKQAMTSIR